MEKYYDAIYSRGGRGVLYKVCDTIYSGICHGVSNKKVEMTNYTPGDAMERWIEETK